MANECSICLSSFKEPVSIPCGHIYCTKCLVDHVNTPSNDTLRASCPTCRASFSLASPDLTYLPKKYHEFVVPNVRRVYVDATRQPNLQSLQKSLQLSKSKIQKLERDQEVLLQQCERHMAAAHAQAEGERAARETAAKLLQTIHDMEHEFRTVTTQAEDRIKVLEAGTENLHIKYEDLKYRYSKRKARHEADASALSLLAADDQYPVDPLSQPSASYIDPRQGRAKTTHNSSGREIRPIPQRRPKTRARPVASPPPVPVFRKRQRYSQVEDDGCECHPTLRQD